MKVHQFARGLWEQDLEPSSLRKHFKSLPSNFQPDPNTISLSTFDLKTFIETETASKNLGSCNDTSDSPQVEMQGGGTRWNPTQEQISILEMLYRGGMRTPNAQQIEQITVQLGKYGKIEGKNVFYWFQNHKARERQKQKRTCHIIPSLINQSPTPAATPLTSTLHPVTHHIKSLEGMQRKVMCGEIGNNINEEESILKRKCRTWTIFECLEEDKKYRKEEGDRTLLLFPLHPEN